MLEPYSEPIDTLGFVFSHMGSRRDGDNRIYAVAAEKIGPDGSRTAFSSLVRYPHLTARERTVSNVSAAELSQAPDPERVARRLQAFFEGLPFVFGIWREGDGSELPRYTGIQRAIDLGFAAEFFLPHLGAFSPQRTWEYLTGRRRAKISFAAEEMARLAVDLIGHICTTVLNDRIRPEAAALRHYLIRSDTLFGSALVHIARNNRGYFGGLFDACATEDTALWQPFLQRARPIRGSSPPGRAEHAPRPAPRMQQRFSEMAAAGKDFSLRPEQVAYAEQVAAALADGAVLTIEAGTGTGKTQGYLVPLMDYLDRHPDARAVISTYTKNLQEQILLGEITRTRAVFKMYRDIPVALLKGKSSYVCAEKLDHIWEDGWRGAALLGWLYFVIVALRFRDVDLDACGMRIRRSLGGACDLDRLASEVSAKDGCTPRHHRCPAQVIAAEAYYSRLIVTNHHKLALLDQDTILSGLFTHYVIDEANHFEHAVRSAFGVELHSRDLRGTVDFLSRAARRLSKTAAGDTHLALAEGLSAMGRLRRLVKTVHGCLSVIRRQTTAAEMMTLPPQHPAFPDGTAVAVVEGMARLLARIRERFNRLMEPHTLLPLGAPRRMSRRLKTALNRVQEYEDALKAIRKSLSSQEHVTAYQQFLRNWALRVVPVDVAGLIRQHVFSAKDTVIFTAATLSVKGRFDTFKKICGMTAEADDGGSTFGPRDFRFQRLPSPFEASAMAVIVPPEAVSGKYSNKAQWLDSVVHMLPRLIAENRGRTLVLFSSYADLTAVASRMTESIDGAEYPLIIQHKGAATANLCEEFRGVKESVLLGVDTFWYGVDFKGDTLTQVIITRIPYPSPMDPIQQARKQVLSPREYWQRYMYETDIKMRQGMGRLIRSETDRGRVVVLDSRFKA